MISIITGQFLWTQKMHSDAKCATAREKQCIVQQVQYLLMCN